MITFFSLRRYRLFAILLITGILTAPGFQKAYADIRINIVVANPSETERQKVPVRFRLPQEITKEDVVNAGGMRLEYNEKNSCYYAVTEVELGPKETATYKISVTDKWTIPTQSLETLRKQLTDSLATLDKSDEYETAKLVADKIQAKIEALATSQSEGINDIEKKISSYRSNQMTLKQIEDDIYSLEHLAKTSAGAQEGPTVKFIIEATNAKEEPLETVLKHALPKEVRPEYVLDNKGFDVDYDSKAEQFYLVKQEKFAPKETKRYEIEIKDVWRITDPVLNSYREEITKLNDKLAVTKYKEVAQPLFDDAMTLLDAMVASQSAAESIQEKIAAFRVNTQREEQVKEDQKRLEQLLIKTVINMSLDQKSKQQINNILKQIDALKQLRVMSEAFKKKVMEKIAVWKVVFYVVFFIIIFTAFSYLVWFLRLKKEDERQFVKVKKPEQETQ